MQIESFKIISDFPFVHNEIFYDGALLDQNKSCKTCKEKDCLTFLKTATSKNSYLCSRKYNNFLLYFNEKKFLINGLILDSNRDIPKDRKFKRSNYCVSDTEVCDKIKRYVEIEKIISEQLSTNIEKNFEVFHDIKNALAIVQKCADLYIDKMNGSDFQEKLRHTPIEITDLYDALSLVNSQLGMMDVLVNSESISQGSKNPTNIYKMFHRFNKLFAYKGKDKNITIRWKDDGQIPYIDAYQSLEFIPIILLDNAIKYSTPNSTIWVNFHKSNTEIVVTISSKGQIIPENERETIFEKYGRGSNAKEQGDKGIGMGLWLARQILLKHGSDIYYYPTEGGQDGDNNFEFRLKLIFFVS